jgi:hypothetical protein
LKVRHPKKEKNLRAARRGKCLSRPLEVTGKVPECGGTKPGVAKWFKRHAHHIERTKFRSCVQINLVFMPPEKNPNPGPALTQRKAKKQTDIGDVVIRIVEESDGTLAAASVGLSSRRFQRKSWKKKKKRT